MRTRMPLFLVLIAIALIAIVIAATRPRSVESSTGAATASAASSLPAPAASTTSSSAIVASSGSGAPLASSSHASLARATWGSAIGQLGRSRPHEGNAEGPMSLAVGADGATFVLDQVNGRIIRYATDGTKSDVRINARAAQDLAIGKDGSIAVLDRLGDRRVDILGADGRPRGSFPLVGPGILEGGAVTGVFIDGESVYVERAHGALIRLGDISGHLDSGREEILGRPLRDGSGFGHAWIEGNPPTDHAFVAVNDRATSSNRFTRQITPGSSIFGIATIDSDRGGTIYLGLVVGDGSPSTISVHCLEPLHGAPIGVVTFPLSALPDETFRELAIADGGGVTYLYRTEEGAELMRGDCRGR